MKAVARRIPEPKCLRAKRRGDGMRILKVDFDVWEGVLGDDEGDAVDGRARSGKRMPANDPRRMMKIDEMRSGRAPLKSLPVSQDIEASLTSSSMTERRRRVAEVSIVGKESEDGMGRYTQMNL
jgi:hypothetical protein